MEIIGRTAAVHGRLALELADAGETVAAKALDRQSHRYVYAGEGWSHEEAENRAQLGAAGAGRQLLCELADEIAAGLKHLAEEAFDGDGGQSAAGFMFRLLWQVTEAVAPEEVGARVAQTIVDAAGGLYLPEKKTVVRESNLNSADRPGQSDRTAEGSTTHEPPTSVPGLKIVGKEGGEP